MTDPAPSEPPKNRRWFVILAVVTLLGLAAFTAAITILSIRLPELKKSGLRPPAIEERTWLA